MNIKNEKGNGKNFADWLYNKLLEWEKEQGVKRSSYTAFTRWLDPEIKQPYVSDWINGKRLPSEENAAILAMRLGIDIYDFLPYEKPDFRLEYIKLNWENLSEELRNKIEKKVREELKYL